MSEVPSFKEADDSSEPPMTIEERIQELRVKVESHQGLAQSIREEINRDMGRTWDLVAALGLENGETVSREELAKLWEDRNMDEAAIIDLYLYIHTRKQKLYGSTSVEPIRLHDLTEAARKKLPLQLRYEQTEGSVAILKALGFEENDIERRFQKGSKSHVQGLRLVSWLATQPYMSDFRKKVSDKLDENDSMTSSELFATAMAEVEWQTLGHINNKNVNYDMSIGYEIDAYQRRTQELKTALILSRHVFYGDDLRKYVHTEPVDIQE